MVLYGGRIENTRVVGVHAVHAEVVPADQRPAARSLCGQGGRDEGEQERSVQNGRGAEAVAGFAHGDSCTRLGSPRSHPWGAVAASKVWRGVEFSTVRRLLIAVAVVVGLLALAAGGGWLWLRRSGLPQRQGRVMLPGLAAIVTVRFDRYGVPTIEAGSAIDAMAALGWLHANDRLFQMELTRRAATGRLAELFGERALAYDRSVRRLDMLHFGDRLLAAATPETRTLLEAYARGVNAWIASRGGDLPPEFRLRAGPSPGARRTPSASSR